ncbi:MAG: hypothetical protein KHY93_16010 [Clostridiales bacterium]|nr:hypothetical protein [Clostridiales bacterium]
MHIEKSSSNYLIVASGTAMTFNNTASLELKLTFDPSFFFIINFTFETDVNNKQELKSSIDTETNTITLTCINFNNSLGTGTTTPLELATYQGKKILLHFWVYALGEGATKKIDYCLYQER